MRTLASPPAPAIRAPDPPPAGGGGRPPRLLDRVRAERRLRHYSRRTDEAYAAWGRRDVRFPGLRHSRAWVCQTWRPSWGTSPPNRG